MKVLIAIDSFKGSISSIKGSEAISLGLTEAYNDAEISTLPLADGGEGTVEALVHSTEGQWIEKMVRGPLDENVNAMYGVSGDGKTAMIEVAAACGLPLISRDLLNPLKTSTYGVGELINDAIEKGCRHFIIGLGGSATNDAGVGMLQALGYKFLDDQNQEVKTGGKVLREIQHIDTNLVNPLLKDCKFQVACDVNNYLYGVNGAAYVYGPQKGATEDDVKELDKGLESFANRVSQELKLDIHAIEGAGAAGGLGAAFAGFLNADLQSGIELVLEIIGLEKYIQGADFVITGEGMLDGQTSMGKAPIGVAQLAEKYDVPVIALAGGINQDNFILNDRGMTSCFSIINAPMTLGEAMDSDTTFRNLRFTANQLFRLVKAIHIVD
ncbi:glycerate kinase [Virgibacillus sp. NKC19-16]|uniref:glycerate kinase n=1 Tax=Virgibacillus salidurans TaxID=2831673 RepID=UPI001F415DDC|nr:glycerate kinase [Virgibacillus sp. NKC19-16]UJL47409.1 glycerate kinase [Virgibacillus sp. NKC19-16]